MRTAIGLVAEREAAAWRVAACGMVALGAFASAAAGGGEDEGGTIRVEGASQPGAAPGASADGLEVRVYDVRDLAASVNAAGDRGAAPVLASRFTVEGTLASGFTTPFLTMPTAESGLVPTGDDNAPAPMDVLMDAVAGPHAMDVRALTPGVYLIAAPRESHDLIGRLMEDLRGVYAERYDVEVRAFLVSRADAPKVGEACRIEASAAFSSATSVAARRTPAELRSTRVESYVGNWQPVVGNAVFAHDPEIRTVESGLTVRVTAGSGRETDKGIPVRLTGLINDAAMMDAAHPDSAMSPLRVMLPVTNARTLDADVAAPNGQATVACVVDGFEIGTCIVISVEVRRH